MSARIKHTDHEVAHEPGRRDTADILMGSQPRCSRKRVSERISTIHAVMSKRPRSQLPHHPTSLPPLSRDLSWLSTLLAGCAVVRTRLGSDNCLASRGRSWCLLKRRTWPNPERETRGRCLHLVWTLLEPFPGHLLVSASVPSPIVRAGGAIPLLESEGHPRPRSMPPDGCR
jgi:hypothetical protein